MTKEIVVFANSVKHGNSCVAGKCTETRKWIRPVSNNNGGEILVEQTVKASGYRLKILDKVKIDLSHHAPLNHQTENHVIKNTKWMDAYFLKKEEIISYLDSPKDLWGEGDRVCHDEIIKNKKIRNSLYLVQVNQLELFKDQNDKRRAKFSYGEVGYNLAVTGREFDSHFKKNSTFLRNAIICVSLGENFNGYCYKLVAAIIY